MSRSEHAVEQFGRGLNCSQSVLGEYAGDLGLDATTACKVACGFGGGLGRTGGTCGAVSGATMVIGLAVCDPDPQGLAAKLRTYELVRSFLQEFQARHGSTSCRELLGCDISTPEGYAAAKEAALFDTRCSRYVEDAVEILEDLLP